MSDVYRDRGAGAKAARYVAEGRVSRVENAESFAVEGDTGIWLVVLVGGAAYCNCPATVDDCSHVRASRRFRTAEKLSAETVDDPFAGLDAGR